MWQQARRPEIMVYAALVILGINSFSGRPTRLLTTLRLGTFNHERRSALTVAHGLI